MKIKTGVNFHNRFDIVKNGEWVGYAENIILNQMYNRICNFSTYFANIHFGTGSGTPTPNRTSLFSHLGTKTAEVEEKIKAYPTSKVTKKITLMPEEYVGQTITEVGVAYGSTASYLVTHAMIKDSEGNPLSITKTELDVVTIYATVFVELQDSNNVSFSKLPPNALVNYFLDGSAMNPKLWISSSTGGSTPFSKIGFLEDTFDLTRTVNVTNRKTTYSTRLGINDANQPIRELSLENICRIGLEEASTWNPINLSNQHIGLGDGVTTSYNLGWNDLSNVVVKVDGNITSDYVIENLNSQAYMSLWQLAVRPDEYPRLSRGVFINEYSENTTSIGTTTIEVDSGKIVGKALEFEWTSGRAFGGNNVYNYADIYGSYDGEDFELINTVEQKVSGTTVTVSDVITEPYNFIKIRIYPSRSYDTEPVVRYVRVIDPDYSAKIIFASPPPEGSTITADYTVPYIPKTEEYVLDVEFTLQFGERV